MISLLFALAVQIDPLAPIDTSAPPPVPVIVAARSRRRRCRRRW